jgi:hypothetical protein
MSTKQGMGVSRCWTGEKNFVSYLVHTVTVTWLGGTGVGGGGGDCQSAVGGKINV